MTDIGLIGIPNKGMSQKPAMQYRAPTANGSGRRRTDKDLGGRSDKIASYPARSSSDNSGNAVGFHALYNHLNSENISPADNNRLPWEGTVSGSRGRVPERTLNDRLLLITMLLIGQPVEVQVKNGSIYSGIFHTANTEKDYGVVLKMARLTKDGSAKGGGKDMFKDLARRAPLKTLIILAKDLVQVIAKDIPLAGDGMVNGRARENKHEIVTDSFLAQSHPIEVERELKPWTPDKDAPENIDLENTFQNTQNRHWDQFETNKSLFGVESTFDEELYTTKLERGPQTKDLERRASRIAREMEDAATVNFHLAEERGLHFGNEEESFDEERRYSSVLRSEDISEDNEDKCIDNHNEETFGIAKPCTKDVPSFSNDTKGSTSLAGEPDNKSSQTIQTSLTDSSVVRVSPHHNIVGSDTTFISSNVSDQSTTQPLHLDSTNSQIKNVNRDLNDLNLHTQLENQANCQTSFAECTTDKPKEPEIRLSDVSIAGHTSPLPATSVSALSALTCEPADVVESSRPASSSKGALSTQAVSPQEQLTVTSRTGKSGSLASELPTSCSASSSVLVSSMDSSKVSSLRKSALNPNAKEFKLNPNAKSYTPCFSTPRPAASPVVQGPVYVAGSIPPMTPIQSVPAGLGVSSLAQQVSQPPKFAQYNNAVTASGVGATSYIQPVATFVPRVSGAAVPAALTTQPAVKIPPPGQQVIGHSLQQPIRYTSQAAPLHQAPAYLHPNAQMYSQQMVFGQPGQVVYIQPYPNEMMQGPHVNPPQGSVPPQAASHQAQQPKHRGAAVHGMQYCVAAPFVSGQHPYIQSTPVSHLPNTLQPSPGVLVQPSVPGIQIHQGIVAGIGPTAQNGTGLTGSSGIWVGGKGTTGNFQQ